MNFIKYWLHWLLFFEAPKQKRIETVICPNCQGRGHGDGDLWLFICPQCDGEGKIKVETYL